jgi:hypothetical protein
MNEKARPVAVRHTQRFLPKDKNQRWDFPHWNTPRLRRPHAVKLRPFR